MEGINAARKTIPFARFDKTRCAQGLDALRSWDEKARAFKKPPEHNWASHGADAWRYLSLSWRAPMRIWSPRKYRSASRFTTSPWISSWTSRTAGRHGRRGFELLVAALSIPQHLTPVVAEFTLYEQGITHQSKAKHHCGTRKALCETSNQASPCFSNMLLSKMGRFPVVPSFRLNSEFVRSVDHAMSPWT
jgi:hypothetical protein